MNATEFWEAIPCVVTSVRALAIAAISSGKGVIMSIVSYLKLLSLVRDAVQQYFVFNLWGASQFYAAGSSCTLKSPLPLQPQGMLRSGHLSVRKARHKPHTSGNSGAGCQDGSKHSARGHWQKEIFCKQQNYFCCLWIVSSNLSVPLLLGVPWEIALIFHQFHHWPVHWLFLPSFWAEQHIAMKGVLSPHLSCLSYSRGTWILVSP